MRTPAEDYFGAEGFSELLEALTKFGQEKLGCTAISPPWLSVYVDGCEQRYHTDSWHGPWAFVLSLTGECGENNHFDGLRLLMTLRCGASALCTVHVHL